MMQAKYHKPQVQKQVENLNWINCQKHKLKGPGHGLLPKCLVWMAPWFEVATDMIVPLTIEASKAEYKLYDLTCIDKVTNLTDLSQK